MDQVDPNEEEEEEERREPVQASVGQPVIHEDLRCGQVTSSRDSLH